MDASKLLQHARIVPVVVIDDADHAVPLARCLLEAGIDVIEITLRTAQALEAIRLIAQEVPDMVTGAGSIRTTAQVDDVLTAGGRFGVSPGATANLLAAVAEAKLPFVAGAVTASEMMNLYERGYQLQKFFPAELAGGAAFLKAVRAPLPEVRFMPTGGITPQLAPGYLALPNVLAIGGSWITPGSLLKTGDFAAIGRLAKEAVELAG